MRKYFFSYHLVSGIPFPLMWAEEDGICVGGRPLLLVGELIEISLEEFTRGELSPLEKEFPLFVREGVIAITGLEDPDLV